MDYISNSDTQSDDMLKKIGVSTLDELLSDIPANIRARQASESVGLDETTLLKLAANLASRNKAITTNTSFLGAGVYQHLIPTAVDAIAARGEWLTPYTPYQAEASQGILQSIYEFQSFVCGLFQMDVANASLYDGSSAAAEAALLSHRYSSRARILVSETVHPHTRQVISTYMSGSGVVIQEIPSNNGLTNIEDLRSTLGSDVACVIMQQPNVFGLIEPMAEASDLTHRAGGLFVSSVNPVSLGILKPPGEYGADIAVAEAGFMGSPTSYGGPGLGLFATTKELMRKVPGRLSGATVDANGKRSFTLTLQTREQHIRREKATSNICTNEGWLTTRAAIYLSMLGAEGFKDLSRINLEKAHDTYTRMCEIPWISPTFKQPFFNEFVLTFDSRVDFNLVSLKLAESGFIAGKELKNWFPTLTNSSLWCVTEAVSNDEIDRMIEALASISTGEGS